MSVPKCIKPTPAKWWLSPGAIFHKGKKAVTIPTFVDPEPPSSACLCSSKTPSIILSKSAQITPKKKKGTMMSGCGKAIWLCFSEITVEPVLFLYMLSTFSLFTLFQDLIYARACLSTFSQIQCDTIQSASADMQEAVQKTASHWILMSTVSLVLPSIFIAIYLGSWSDKFGRKWPIVFPPLGGVLACIVYIVLAFDTSIHVGYICLASFLSGLSGGFVSCIMSCMTYVAAVSSEENRTLRISRLEAMIFFGGTVGPFLSGTMVQHIGHGYAFVFMMICYGVSSLYALLFVKEVRQDKPNEGDRTQSRNSNISNPTSVSSKTTTLESQDLDLESSQHLLTANNGSDKFPDHLDTGMNDHLDNLPDIARSAEVYLTLSVEDKLYPHNSMPNQDQDCNSSTAASEDEQRNILRRRTISEGVSHDDPNASCCSRYFGSEHFTSALKTVVKKRQGGRRLYLILSVIAGYIGMMITAGELDVAYLFAKGKPLQWNHQIFSYYFGFKYGLGTLVLLIGMPLFQQFQIRDTTICILGLFSRMAGLVLYALSPDTVVAFMVPIVAIFSFFSIPATRSLLSKLVGPDEQGKIFAFVAIMEDLCTLTASMVFNSLYPLTRPIFKGMIFLIAAAMLVIPIIIMWFVGRRLSRLDKPISSASSTSTRTYTTSTSIGDVEGNL